MIINFIFLGELLQKALASERLPISQCDRFENTVFLLRLVKHRSKKSLPSYHITHIFSFPSSLRLFLSVTLPVSIDFSLLFICFCSQMARGSTADLKDRCRNQIFSLCGGQSSHAQLSPVTAPSRQALTISQAHILRGICQHPWAFWHL